MTQKPSKKDQIVEVASKLFFEQGYHATGIKQIIEAADIAKGTFYSHFRSKEELGLVWLERGNQKWRARLDAFLSACPSPREKLVALFDFQTEMAKGCCYRGCPMLNTLAESPELGCPMREAIQGYKQAHLDFILSLVAAHLPEATEDDRRQRASAIYLLSEGATVASQSFCDIEPIQVAKTQVLKILSE